uniref:Kazal-like domain-containing protein n=1 Tax=Caenorhabditis japonica TaxID=281687 RepID=A0A8R1I9E0_CAEJA
MLRDKWLMRTSTSIFALRTTQRMAPDLLKAHAACITKITSMYQTQQNATSCHCEMEINPVCVRDGPYQYTYSSMCVFQCAQETRKDLALLYEGSCCSARYCNMFEQPVCADGQVLDHANQRIHFSALSIILSIVFPLFTRHE